MTYLLLFPKNFLKKSIVKVFMEEISEKKYTSTKAAIHIKNV
jgi:hypothetical protein